MLQIHTSDYTKIFNQRGGLYHRAMTEQPLARHAEFESIVRVAEIREGQLVADVPAGGGYLRAFLPPTAQLVAIETARDFLLAHHSGDSQILCSRLSQMPLAANALDRLLSLAAVHHVLDTAEFYREVWRVLKPDGRFALADVRAGSAPAEFLNGWVNAHNSMGHNGNFLDESTPEIVRACGFDIEFCAPISYRWEFDSEPAMVSYCRGLFGLDRANDAQILAGIESILGAKSAAAGCYLNWELQFIGAKKTVAG